MQQLTKSCNTVVVGTTDTGKTFLTKQFAQTLASRINEDGEREQFRPIIVLDHSENEQSYSDFPIFPIEILQYNLDVFENPEYCKMRIKVDGDEEGAIDEFFKYIIRFVKNAVLIIDDCGNYFEANLNDIQKRVIKVPKNNGIDMIYQFHLLSEVAKKLLGVTQYFIIKEFADDVNEVGRLPCKTYIEILQNQRVSVMDMNNNFKTHKSYDYFQNKMRRSKR
jgi:hypothetical protein